MIGNTTTIIDLDLGNPTKLPNNNNLFHQDIYRSLAEELQSQAKRNENRNEVGNINELRCHQAILLNGDRGAGKTSILVNLCSFFTNDSNYSEDAGKILFLEPVDPTMLDGHEDFLNIVVGQLNKNKQVQDRLSAASSQEKESYYQHLDRLATALENEQSAKDQFGLDRLLSYQGGLDIAQLAHQYFYETLKLTGRKLVVLTIDDVDMSLCHGFNVLEVVRKHLCSPWVIPIVSGDLQLYRELVANNFTEQLVHKSRSRKEKVNLQVTAQNLAEEYLRKVFPVYLRFNVPAISAYLGKTLGMQTMVTLDKTELGSLYGIHQFVVFALNGRVNGEENSTVHFAPNTARQLIQWLSAIKGFLAELPPGYRSLLNPDQTHDLSALKQSYFKWWLNTPRIPATDLFQLYKQLKNYFNHQNSDDLSKLCEDIIEINANTRFDLNSIAYLKLPLGSDNGDPIDQDLKFTRKYLKTLNNKSAEKNPQQLEELFLVQLFSYDDYYTSYQSAPLVFFGRFFELMTTTLIRDIDEDWLIKLLAKPPYHSIFTISATETYDEDIQIETETEIETSALTDELTPYLPTLASEISKYRSALKNEYKADSFFSDIAFLKAVQEKYFTQLKLYKTANNKITKKFNSSHLKAENIPTGLERLKLKDIAMRAAYSYWSALGSYEKSPLFIEKGETASIIAHQNMFAVDKLVETDPNSYNPAYRLNIYPFLKPINKSYTCLIQDHPVIQIIQNLNIQDEIKSFYFSEELAKRVPQSGENRGNKTVRKAPVRSVKKESVRADISKALSGMITRKQLQSANLSTVLKWLIDALSKIEQYPVKGDISTIDYIKSAKLGEILKTQSFNSPNNPMRYLLKAIWTILLEENPKYTESKIEFIRKLKEFNIDNKLAEALSAGIED